MKFGKEFKNHLDKTLPEWRDKFLRYKVLKKLLKNFPRAVADGLPPGVGTAAPVPALSVLREWFLSILCGEIEKFNDFYVEKELEFIIRFQVLKERIERVNVRGRRDGMMEIRKNFVEIHGEMVLLKSYSSLNFAGLIKILKKYDKRTGEFLTLPFTRHAFHQPFFTTEPLTRLVRDCEANLETLFPLVAEVVESSSVSSEHTSTSNSDTTNASSLETTLPQEEETIDIYSSTLAAINTIQGLKKESSTYNPFSMSYIFGGENDNDSGGVLTAENSPCNSFMELDDEEDEDEEICSSPP